MIGLPSTAALAVTGILLAALAGSGWVAWHEHGVAATARAEARQLQANIEAQQAAEAAARAKQEVINAAIQQQADDLANINSTLSADLDRLRARAARRPMSASAKVDCSGADPTVLSELDARLVTQQAARADELRAALKACYAYADGLQK